MYRGQTLQVRRMYRYYTHKTSLLYRCLLNQFTVHVYTGYVQGWNLINNKWMEKLTIKRWKVNLHLDTYTQTDRQTPHIVAYWAAPFAAKNMLFYRRADIGIGAIKTSSAREFSIDFSMYYHDMSGHTIVMKKTKLPSSMFQFLSVLDNTVWFCVLGLFFFVSVQLWMTDRHCYKFWLLDLKLLLK